MTWRRINGKKVWIKSNNYGKTNKNPSYVCPYCKKTVNNEHDFDKCHKVNQKK